MCIRDRVISGNVNKSVENVTVTYVNETGNETNDTNGSTGGNSSVIVPPDYACLLYTSRCV